MWSVHMELHTLTWCLRIPQVFQHMKQSEFLRHLASLSSPAVVNTCKQEARHDATLMLFTTTDDPSVGLPPVNRATNRVNGKTLSTRDACQDEGVGDEERLDGIAAAAVACKFVLRNSDRGGRRILGALYANRHKSQCVQSTDNLMNNVNSPTIA